MPFITVLALLASLVLGGAHIATHNAQPAPTTQVAKPCVTEFVDLFDAGKLDDANWTITRLNDFSEFAVSVEPTPNDAKDGRLMLKCATMNTDDKTVKCLGVVTRAPLDLRGRKHLSLTFDWNGQSNGCYLTGAVYLCPTLTDKSPEDETTWVKVEYAGVPPGENARAAVWSSNAPVPKCLYNEGWPEQRTGRKIGKVQLDIVFNDGAWQVLEDGKKLFESTPDQQLPFPEAHLYLQMTSHSNYPERELFFDDVRFGPDIEK